MRNMNIEDFVALEFDAVPASMIVKAYCGKNWDLEELTPEDWTDGERNEHLEGGILPMWGYLWTLDGWKTHIILKNLREIYEIGFRVYVTEDVFLIGIDGAGYDFYKAHWEPLRELLLRR